MTTRSWCICRRRSPGSTSASSMRRIRRTATASASLWQCAERLDHRRRHRHRPQLHDGEHRDVLRCPPVRASRTARVALNQTAIGVRYQGAFGGLGVLAYGVYEDQPGCRLHRPEDGGGPRHHDNARQQVQRHLQRPELRQRRRCGDLCRVHRRRQHHRRRQERHASPKPSGGAPLGPVGAKYVNGPWTVGIVGEEYWEQGNVQLTGLTQHRAGASTRRRLHGGARLHGLCRVSVERSDAERHQQHHWCGRYGCEQQHQGSGLPDRQRRELLDSSA